jgi:hypothetical protein
MDEVLRQLSAIYIFFLGVSFVTYFLFFLNCIRGVLYIFIFNVRDFKIGFLLIAIGMFCLFISDLTYQFEEFVHLFSGETVTSAGWYIQTVLDFIFALFMWIGCSKVLHKLKVYFGRDGV